MSDSDPQNNLQPAAIEQPVPLSGLEAAEAESVSTPQSAPPSRDVTIQASASRYIGPMPPPSMLAEYDKVLPGLAERIARRFELQSDHRMQLERAAMSADGFSQRLGTIFSGMIGLCGVCGRVYLGVLGRDVWGFATVLTSLASLVAAYGIGKRSHDKELEQRNARNDSD